MPGKETAVIFGVGAGLSAALARQFAGAGMQVALAARDTDKLAGLATETGARLYRCDVTQPAAVQAVFDAVRRDLAVPDLAVFNPSARARGPIADIDPAEVRDALMVTAYGGFLVGQAAAKAMLPRGSGSILFTGASASVKGFANSSSFAMGKFGLRGLAQAMARELAPNNIHVAHFVIDGGIRRPGDARAEGRGPDGMLEPDEVARSYLFAHRQHRSAWTWEFELRPWLEKF